MGKKISIVLGFPDTNAGGSELGIALLTLLKRHFPDYQLNYISTLGDEQKIAQAYPYVREKHPDVQVLPHPLKRPFAPSTGRMMKGLLWVPLLMRAGWQLVAATPHHKTLAELSDSALIVARGTHIFDVKENYLAVTLGFFWLMYPLLYAAVHGFPFVIYAQAIGPFYNPVIQRLMRFILQKATLVLVRDAHTQRYLEENNYNLGEKLRVVPDTVFSTSPPTAAAIQATGAHYGLPAKDYVVVVIRDLIEKKISIEKYFPEFEKICTVMLDNNIIQQCVIITQCHHFPSFQESESDSAVSQALYDHLRTHLPERLRSRVRLLDEPLPPDRLKELYGGAKYVISMRLHAAIFALIAGTPVVALSYSGLKTEGVMSSLQNGHCVVKMADFSAAKVLAMIQEMEGRYAAECARLQENLRQLRQRAIECPRAFQHLLNSDGSAHV
jgi:polysaccharide pyruvyl transferase WcaK-like protein